MDLEPLGRVDMVCRLQEVAARTKRAHVSFRDFHAETGISARQIMRGFGRYSALVEAAGLRPFASAPPAGDELLGALHEVCLKSGGRLTQSALAFHGRYDLKVYLRRWKSWPAVVAAFRAWADTHDEALPYRAALAETAAASHRRRRLVRPPPADGRRYGEVLNFRHMLHAPVSEQGVVLLFGMVCGDLGFLIESVAVSFPDCEAKRRVPGGGWERLRLEFELASANFGAHGHDADGCDLIVCWEHDWPECPLPVVELKSEIERLRTVRPT